MAPLDEIKAYVEGRTALRTFRDRVIGDPGLQAMLEENVALPRYAGGDSAFLYMMRLDPDSLLSDVNLKEVLSAFLDARSVAHRRDQGTAESYDLVLRASPPWLDLPAAYLRRILDAAPGGTGKSDRLRAMKAAIAADVRYLKRPPRWLQSCVWPMREGRMQVFAGQLAVDDVLHDRAQIYIFIDPVDAQVTTILQTE